jgi:translation initiation factor 3 subunit L
MVSLDEIFLTLYDELCFRHVYARLQPTLEQRYRSFSNYCTLFNHILSKSGVIRSAYLYILESYINNVYSSF